MYLGLHVKYPSFLLDFNETWIFSTDLRKYSNTKFNENLYSGSRVVPCGRADGRTDMFAILRARLKQKKRSININTTNDYILKPPFFTYTEFIISYPEFWKCRGHVYYFWYSQYNADTINTIISTGRKVMLQIQEYQRHIPLKYLLSV